MGRAYKRESGRQGNVAKGGGEEWKREIRKERKRGGEQEQEELGEDMRERGVWENGEEMNGEDW